MLRSLRVAAAMGVVLLASQLTAVAQYGGYGGWGGWGGGGASTPQGDIARGAGVLAAGEGQYNLNTAQARAINANTAMNWNQYWYEAQLNANRHYYAKIAANRDQNVKTQEAMYLRLRDNPNKYDIYRGDALNVIYDELCSPKIYMKGLKTANLKFPGEMIRDVPFSYASAAVTSSVHDITTKGSAPAALKRPEFAGDMAKIREIGAKIRKQDSETGHIDPETLDQGEAAVQALLAKVKDTLPANSKDRNDSERFLKAMLGLVRMLRTPAINVLLADAANHPETTVGDLIGFMKAFNLRFGVADSPREKMVYDQLYPILVKMRDEAFPDRKPELSPEAAGNIEHPAEFFSRIEEKKPGTQVAPPSAPVPPPAPAPRP